jgi:hypothetical protein
MSALTVDLKKTVNLPKTEFSMKANLPTAEPKTLAKWEADKLYHAIRKARAGRQQYVLHDGPPYANGNIHLGTAFNKILKDLIVKSKSMAGFDAPYIPGWDCHGLPIEAKVDKELGPRKAFMSAAEIRAECRAYAAKFVDIHRTEFKRSAFWAAGKIHISPCRRNTKLSSRKPSSISCTAATFIKVSNPFTGASKTAPRWPKLKLNMKITPVRPSTCASNWRAIPPRLIPRSLAATFRL